MLHILKQDLFMFQQSRHLGSKKDGREFVMIRYVFGCSYCGTILIQENILKQYFFSIPNRHAVNTQRQPGNLTDFISSNDQIILFSLVAAS